MKELFASKSTVRAAIFDVIDQGRNQSAEHQDWRFSDSDSDYELRERAVFADAVIRRISELQDLPHQGVKLENLCNRHIRESLPRHSSNVCSACEAERLTSGVERRRQFEEREDYERLRAQFEGKA